MSEIRNRVAWRSSWVPAIACAAFLAGIAAPPTVDAQDQESPKERFERLALQKVTNSEIEWGGGSFRAGPVLAGKNAISLYGVDARYVADLLPMLEKDDTFIVAHVLLTMVWRVPGRDKEHTSIPLSDGYVIAYNGLVVKTQWRDVSGKAVETVTYPSLDQQKKRIVYWWKARYRDHPREFSPRTVVD